MCVKTYSTVLSLSLLLLISVVLQAGCDSAGGADEFEGPTRIDHYVQTAGSGSLFPQDGDSGLYTLTMEQVPFEIYGVIKEPEGDTRRAPFNAFARHFIPMTAESGFPVAVLEVGEGLPEPASVTLELLNISYDADNRTAIYDVNILSDEDTPENLVGLHARGIEDMPQMFDSPTLVTSGGISHGWHYLPDAGDKLGNGASACFESPAHRGVIGFSNSSSHSISMEVEQTSGLGTWKLTFTMEPGASFCAWYSGAWGLHVSSGSDDGYVEVTRDKSVACGGWFHKSCSDSEFSGCSNKLNVYSGQDWDKDGLEAVDGIVQVVGGFS